MKLGMVSALEARVSYLSNSTPKAFGGRDGVDRGNVQGDS